MLHVMGPGFGNLTSPPPNRERIVDWTFELLRTAIVDGELEPGARLSIPALAEQLTVSRSPVREAVQRLVSDGLAVEVPHRGAVVATYGAVELLPVYEIREFLEGLAARLAAERATPDELKEMRMSFDDHVAAIEAGDQQGHFERDAHFHALTRQAADNQWLEALLDQIRGKIQLAMATTSVSDGPDQALIEHRRILEAIESRDPNEAEAAARAHVLRLRMTLARRAGEDGHGGFKDETESLTRG